MAFLETLPDERLHSIITSPPYFGQIDYGDDRQIGLEETIHEYIKALVAVFHEARRVLKSDRTFWLNIGDTYFGATSQHRGGRSQGKTSRYSRKHMNGIPTTGRENATKLFTQWGFQ